MTVVAFVGPSLPPEDRARFDGIEWRPPAEAGDLLRLAGKPMPTLCLIDGYFDHRPAVRHKEILLLLSEGARIFGASSIGALRAAEMDGLGMIGIGAIYRAYASGRIAGDDEVALAHAPEPWAWRPLSVPLVDVRATVHRGVRMGALQPAEARAILDRARRIHYADRAWTEILASASLDQPTLRRFGGRLNGLVVEQKRLDALACLEEATRTFSDLPEPPVLVRTVFLDALARQCGVALAADSPSPGRAARAASSGAPASETDCGTAPTA